MKSALTTWAAVFRALLDHYRTRLPLLLLLLLGVVGSAYLLSHELLSWERWVLLFSGLALLIVCIDFNLMLWRIYRQRRDLQDVRYSLALIGGFVVLVTAGRLVGFASLFFTELLSVVSIINLASAAVATVLVVKSKTVEDYASTMPHLADLQSAHHELSEAHRQLDLREQQALEGMLVLADDTVIEANDEAYRILGYERPQLLGLRVHQLVHEDDSRKAYQNIQQESTPRYYIRLLCKDGSIRQVEATGSLMKRHDTIVRVSTFRDVSLQLRCLELLDKRGLGQNETNDLLVAQADDLRRYFHLEPAGKPTTPHAQ